MNREKLRHQVRRMYGTHSKPSQRITVYHGTSTKYARYHAKKGFHRWANFATRADAFPYSQRRHIAGGKPALIKVRVPKSYFVQYAKDSSKGFTKVRRKGIYLDAKRPIPPKFVRKIIKGRELRALAARYPSTRRSRKK